MTDAAFNAPWHILSGGTLRKQSTGTPNLFRRKSSLFFFSERVHFATQVSGHQIAHVFRPGMPSRERTLRFSPDL